VISEGTNPAQWSARLAAALPPAPLRRFRRRQLPNSPETGPDSPANSPDTAASDSGPGRPGFPLGGPDTPVSG
jgi:hypothetical protein